MEANLIDKIQGREKPRVLIVENELMVGAGLQSLLSGQTDLTVMGISPGDRAELIREIRRIQPDVILLDADTRLTDPVELLALLEDCPKLRVVVVSANDQMVQIYNKYGVSIERVAQFINIMHGTRDNFGR